MGQYQKGGSLGEILYGKGSALSCYSDTSVSCTAVEIHCYMYRQHILQAVLTQFLKQHFLWLA